VTRRPLLAIFLVATLARLAFLLGADQPLLYTHQYTYFTNAMRIAEHPHALSYLLRSDEWRTWDQAWTIAPLYFVFLGGLLKLVGAHLFPVQVIQCVIGGGTAAAVGALGRHLSGRAGLLAGLAYALYGPAVEMPATTMTENLHTPLFVGGILMLLHATESRTPRSAFAAGVILGLSALTRSVSTGFMALGALYYLWRNGRSGIRNVVLMTVGGAAIILPWTARNVFITDDAVLIESAAFENIWHGNSFSEGAQRENQRSIIHEQVRPEDRRSVALHFAVRGVKRNPRAFLEKIALNFWHFLRPEGLHNLLRIERSQEPWRHLMSLLLDDLPFFLALPPFFVFLIAGRRGTGRALVVLWTAYYLLMIVVLFHNEIRYRSAFVPFLFPGAIAGWPILRDLRHPSPRWVAGAVGLWLSAAPLKPFAHPAWNAVRCLWAMRPALEAVDEGRLAQAQTLTESAAGRAPRSPRPWLMLGHVLLAQGHLAESLAAYDRGAALSTPDNWSTRLARPTLLRALGRPEADTALAEAHALSWRNDPWLALEIAWRELPAPRTDSVLVGHDDYGAARGFLYPRGGAPEAEAGRLDWNRYEQLGDVLPPPGTHRWSRHRAWLRLRPLTIAPRYTATLVMGSPFPSTRDTADVSVRASDGSQHRFTVDRELRAYTLLVTAVDGVVTLQLDAPTWNRAGEPADQGVRVDRFSVAP
jgi:hypothetical protein